MSGESLALETQLLLQEVTQATQFEVVVDAGDDAAPPVSEFEAAKLALVEKLRKKKELNRQQQQQLNAKRYGIKSTPAATATAAPTPEADVNARLTPTKAKRAAKLPIAATAHAGSRQKKELLSKLRTQAIQQGAREMAKLFGYKSYEEQLKKLNEIELKKLLESARQEQEDKRQELQKEKLAAEVMDKEDEDSSSDYADAGVEVQDVDEEDAQEEAEATKGDEATPEEEPASPADEAMVQAEPYEETQDLEALEAQEAASRQTFSSSPGLSSTRDAGAKSPEVVRRRRNHITVDDEDKDGNEADSEEDGKEDADEEEEEEEDNNKTPRDKAAGFRQLLQAEAAQTRKRKRLRKGGADFVDDEAEEDEEEDVLKIGGLGDFGFGVPQAASKESKEAEDERNALKLREDDLEGIVDDLSDDERAQERDLEEIHRKELEDLDRQQVKEVMRNVKEGFGRNRRAFSNLEGGSTARGRFNLNELVAADGDRTEAARLGLLESDEDMNDDDDDEEGGSKKKEEEEEEEDEEAAMERAMRERYQNQPKIYITSSESENEDENEVEDQDDEAVKEEIESDEERERQQMKLFSERARINRRMQRMKDLERQIAEDNKEPTAKGPLPNILLEEDEDSQSLLKVLNRTDVSKVPENAAVAPKDGKATIARSKGPAMTGIRPKMGRFNSFGMGSSVSRSASSFSRVVDNCKLFSAGSTNSSSAKGFVFTSFSSDRADRTDENAAPGADESSVGDAAPSSASLAKSKSWGGSSAASRTAKRPFAASNGASGAAVSANKKRKSDFFSVLASYQCVSQSTDQ